MSDLILQASRGRNGRAVIEALLADRVVARDAVDLQSIDDRRRCAAIIHEAVPALELEAIEAELLAIDPERLASTSPGADDPWGDPVSIERPALPLFPVDALPEPLRAWVIGMAKATQTPSDLAGLLGLAICSGAVARRIEVEAGRGWIEPINLFIACLLDPGNRKSAVFSSAIRPLREIEREMIEAAAPEIGRAQAERRIREATQKEAEKKAARGDQEAFEQSMRLAEELAGEPIPAMPKLIVDDATAEAVEIALAAQGGRLVIAGAEGGLFDTMAGRYSSGVGNLDCFLKGHAGDTLRVDRVTRGSLLVDRPCLTLAYAVQPEILRGMADRSSFRGRGLIGRFIYSLPESPLGKRVIDPGPVTDKVVAGYDRLIRRLALIEDDHGDPWQLRLSPDAADRFREWQSEVEPMLGDNGRLEAMRDWGGKLAGLTARLAAVVHLIATDQPEPWRDPVGPGSIAAAVELSRWAIPHAEASIGLMAGGDGSSDDAAYILRWLRQRTDPDVSRRDIHVHGRARFDNDPERLDRALGVLVERGWIRPIDDGPRGPGRPSVRYAVHPVVTARPLPQVQWRTGPPPWEATNGRPESAARVTGVL